MKPFSIRQLAPRQWDKLRREVLALTTEVTRAKAQERFERLRMQHFTASNVVPDPIGCWREELQCAGCGTCLIQRAQYLPPPSRAIMPGPACKGYFNGRPRNRCGWPTSRVWLFVPDQTL